MMNGFLRHLDFLGGRFPSLLDRYHHEAAVVRQFFLKEEELIRLYLNVPLLVTAKEPLKPYADEKQVSFELSPTLNQFFEFNRLFFLPRSKPLATFPSPTSTL